jgi:hypothetical protein
MRAGPLTVSEENMMRAASPILGALLAMCAVARASDLLIEQIKRPP